MQAVLRQLPGRNIAAGRAARRGLADEPLEHRSELALRIGNLLVAMKEVDKRLIVMGPELGAQAGVRREHRNQSLGRITRLLGNGRQQVEVASHLPLMPGNQDCLDVREVLVEGRAANTGFLRNLGHRHPAQAMLAQDCGCAVQGRLAHRMTVGVDRIGPEPGHIREYTCEGDSVS